LSRPGRIVKWGLQYFLVRVELWSFRPALSGSEGEQLRVPRLPLVARNDNFCLWAEGILSAGEGEQLRVPRLPLVARNDNFCLWAEGILSAGEGEQLQVPRLPLVARNDSHCSFGREGCAFPHLFEIWAPASQVSEARPHPTNQDQFVGALDLARPGLSASEGEQLRVPRLPLVARNDTFVYDLGQPGCADRSVVVSTCCWGGGGSRIPGWAWFGEWGA
jgi:hypothetical protein